MRVQAACACGNECARLQHAENPGLLALAASERQPGFVPGVSQRPDFPATALYNAVPKDILDAVICEEMSDETMPGIFQKIDRRHEKGRGQTMWI